MITAAGRASRRRWMDPNSQQPERSTESNANSCLASSHSILLSLSLLPFSPFPPLSLLLSLPLDARCRKAASGRRRASDAAAASRNAIVRLDSRKAPFYAKNATCIASKRKIKHWLSLSHSPLSLVLSLIPFLSLSPSLSFLSPPPFHFDQ